MNLDDLSASDLAHLDAICLEFERDLRQGKHPAVEEIVSTYDGPHTDVLRRELAAVKEEVGSGDSSVTPSFGSAWSEPTSNLPIDNASATVVLDASNLANTETQIGPYRITGELGRGGMGVVYDAIDTRLDRRVAIKMLNVTGAKRRELMDRFEREARAVAAITHPNIVELFDVGVVGGIPYAVMEYLDGETLADRLDRQPFSISEVRALGANIAEALAVAHARNVVHRDLKPQNVMMVGSQRAALRVKLFDFGLSRAPRESMTDLSETKAGTILGTPGYMSPEQARGEQAAAAADVFSLGCLLYEAFYGSKAIDGPTLADRLAATLAEIPQPDAVKRLEDPKLADLIQRCLAKAQADRPSSQELVELLGTPREAVNTTHDSGMLARRRFLMSVGGGFCGAIVGSINEKDATGTFDQIRSIAVLSIQDISPAGQQTGMPSDGDPLGNRPMNHGQKLSSLLVNELARMNDIAVIPFRPLEAKLPSEFRQLARELGVDAFVTGTVKVTQQGDTKHSVIELKLVSAEGNQLGDTLVSETDESWLRQSRFAGGIAKRIGRRLTPTADASLKLDDATFFCLVDGKVRSDPDSVVGLQRALMCFEKASKIDDQFVEPLAGIALTSITLAAQSDQAEEHVARAREHMQKAITLDPSSTKARLARAMLNWQTRPRVPEALAELRELTMTASDNWQVQHQYGLLQLALSNHAAAQLALRDASRLNPHSVTVRTDQARAAWISGDTQLAINDAMRYSDHDLARGLLVDIYEQQQMLDAAAELHDTFPVNGPLTPQMYFEHRKVLLGELPYGPFGSAMNLAILQARLGEIDDKRLSELADSISPMFPLLIAVHPAMQAVRSMSRAQALLPINLVKAGESTGSAGI